MASFSLSVSNHAVDRFIERMDGSPKEYAKVVSIIKECWWDGQYVDRKNLPAKITWEPNHHYRLVCWNRQRAILVIENRTIKTTIKVQ